MRTLDKKKRNIALSALDVFQKKGMEKATVSDIVRGAGIAQGTFYLYFPSKLSVIPSIASLMVEKMADHLYRQLDMKSPFQDQVHLLINTIFNHTKEYRDINAMIYAGLGTNKQLDEWEELYDPYYDQVEALIVEAKQTGEMRTSLEARQTAILLIGMIEAAADQSFLYANEDDNQVIEHKKQDIADFVMYGLIKK